MYCMMLETSDGGLPLVVIAHKIDGLELVSAGSEWRRLVDIGLKVICRMPITAAFHKAYNGKHRGFIESAKHLEKTAAQECATDLGKV